MSVLTYCCMPRMSTVSQCPGESPEWQKLMGLQMGLKANCWKHLVDKQECLFTWTRLVFLVLPSVRKTIKQFVMRQLNLKEKHWIIGHFSNISLGLFSEIIEEIIEVHIIKWYCWLRCGILIFFFPHDDVKIQKKIFSLIWSPKSLQPC